LLRAIDVILMMCARPETGMLFIEEATMVATDVDKDKEHSGESYCSYADGAQYNMVQIHGTRFTPNGPVNLAFSVNGNLVDSQNVWADWAGGFWCQSNNFEFCQMGKALAVLAMDLSNLGYSNTLKTRIC
jgi:hypothetical protein